MESNPGQDRRHFLKTVGGATAAVAAVATALEGRAGAEDADLQGLEFAVQQGSGYALELNGKVVGLLSSASGGAIYAEVITEKLGGDQIARKHLGPVKYEDIVFTCGTGLTKELYEWVGNAVAQKGTPVNGAVLSLDSKGREAARLEFSSALISEVAFPMMDASSKEAARISVRVTPSLVTAKSGTQRTVLSPTTAPKAWLAGNFKLDISTMPNAMTVANKVERLVVSMQVINEQIGTGRGPLVSLGAVDIPDLVVTFSESRATEAVKWHEDFVIKGNNSIAGEATGALTWKATDLKTDIGSLTFKGLGIYRLRPEDNSTSSTTVRRLKAEMYCEEMAFKFSATGTPRVSA